MASKVTIREIQSVKDEGNQAFKQENYYKAIMLYEEGLRRCKTYQSHWEGALPFKTEFGENPKLTDGSMYYQEFSRLKSMLFNNISVCYFNMNSIPKSEKFNDMALMEDPDYAKALIRKILIQENKGEFEGGYQMANYAVTRFDDDFEDEANRKMVPQFKELRDKLKDKINNTKQMSSKEKKVSENQQIDQMFGDFNGFGMLDDLQKQLSNMSDYMQERKEQMKEQEEIKDQKDTSTFITTQTSSIGL
eukprot:403365360